ncbi:fused response regulator/phosphatase [Streptomyces sp. NPDC048290]|uniref:PP2C family protein-serine/threonine phosphatase n=1 Tax=Streptomyces sp. NPDC048290 TaxID=3155811 RepID=UPI003448A632
MPVPVPRQRAIPALENDRTHPASTPASVSGSPSTPPSMSAPVPPEPAPESGSVAEVGSGAESGSVADAAVAGSPPGSVRDGSAGETAADAGADVVGHAAGAPTGGGGRAGAGPADGGGTTGKDPGTGGALTLLLIEDDPAGSAIVPELLDSAGQPIRVRTARNLTEAGRLLTHDVHCILLDLALSTPGGSTSPDGDGDELAVLRHVLRLAPRHAVLALTASGDAERGAEAVRVGAQDYLFRDELDGRLLSRAIRYAVERKRSDTAERRLAEGRLRAQENARLERGLLPTPLLEGSSLRFAARYRPGRSRALLGGDFYDIVRTPDGTVHAMIGDVSGHGPDEAALGVELRIAWRALTFAGLCGDELLGTLQQVLEHERGDDEIFATLCTVDIAPDGRRAGLCLAGHPAPLIARAGHPAALLPYDNNGPALGLLSGARWPRMQVELGPEWSLMLYTDGLIEGRVGTGGERLGQDGMVEMVRRQLARGLRGEPLLRAAVQEVRQLNGGELTDDVAVVLLER